MNIANKRYNQITIYIITKWLQLLDYLYNIILLVNATGRKGFVLEGKLSDC